MCVPRRCAPAEAADEVFPYFFRLTLSLALQVLPAEANGLLAPSQGGALVMENFHGEDKASFQAVFDAIYTRYDGYRREFDDAGDYASHLNFRLCWEDFDRSADLFHGLSSLSPARRPGRACIERGQQMFSVEVVDWCALPARLRGDVHDAVASLAWRGGPMHLCMPAQCGAAALRGVVLPDYLHRLLGSGQKITRQNSQTRNSIGNAIEHPFLFSNANPHWESDNPLEPYIPLQAEPSSPPRRPCCRPPNCYHTLIDELYYMLK